MIHADQMALVFSSIGCNSIPGKNAFMSSLPSSKSSGSTKIGPKSGPKPFQRAQKLPNITEIFEDCGVYRADSLLKRHAHAVGIDRAELFCAPGLVLQCAIGVHFSPAFLVLGIHGLNAFYRESHHGLVADLARQFLVAHASDVQIGVAAVDSCVVWWRGITKRFLEAADLRPPI